MAHKHARPRRRYRAPQRCLESLIDVNVTVSLCSWPRYSNKMYRSSSAQRCDGATLWHVNAISLPVSSLSAQLDQAHADECIPRFPGGLPGLPDHTTVLFGFDLIGEREAQ